ncbi:MAG: hypothetical protein IPM54_03075 [Polyangiaceae bacterium]|nr:hypothetical protein [Polyangiaceae bacterium]
MKLHHHAQSTSVRPRTCVRAWIASSFLATAIVATATNSFALEPVPPPGGEKIKTGFALMAGGAIVTGVGVAIYVANENSGKSSCVPCAQSSWVLPAVLMGIGGAMFATGGTVFTIGLVQRSRATAPSATLMVGPLSVSARLSF